MHQFFIKPEKPHFGPSKASLGPLQKIIWINVKYLSNIILEKFDFGPFQATFGTKISKQDFPPQKLY